MTTEQVNKFVANKKKKKLNYGSGDGGGGGGDDDDDSLRAMSNQQTISMFK